MAIADRRRDFDGFATLADGVDSSTAPIDLPPTQAAWARNVTFRSGGYAMPRPGWRQVQLRFPDGNGGTDATLKSRFEDGLFQGATAYLKPGGDGQLVVAVGGRLFTIQLDGSTGTVQEHLADDPVSSTRPRRWMTQAADFLVIQDGESRPAIYDGSQMRRSQFDEVPVGEAMAYALGRLWVARPDGRSFIGSDLIYGPSGTGAYGYRDGVIKFTEWLDRRDTLAIDAAAGQIRALGSLAVQNTITGTGPLQVFTDYGAISVNLPFDRDQWLKLTEPALTVSLLSPGPLSDWSLVNVNGDLWFKARDGIRSFQVASRAFNTWVNTPLSEELERLASDEHPPLFTHASGALFDNRLLMTARPTFDSRHGIYWRSLVSLNFRTVSGMRQRTAPAWEGEWDGLNVLWIGKILWKDNERCFLLVLDENKKIALWELIPTATLDNDTTPITWQLESRALGGTDRGWTLKELLNPDVWLDEINQGQVPITLEYRSDGNPNWRAWTSWCETGPTFSCASACPPGCPPKPTYYSRRRLPLPEPGDCDTPDDKPAHWGYEFQVRFTVQGQARLRRFRASMRIVDEMPQGACPPNC
jgi:hypothetical protein